MRKWQWIVGHEKTMKTPPQNQPVNGHQKIGFQDVYLLEKTPMNLLEDLLSKQKQGRLENSRLVWTVKKPCLKMCLAPHKKSQRGEGRERERV